MKLSDRGAALIKAFESCEQSVKGRPGFFAAYRCPADVLTIGWGHTNHHGRRFKEHDHWSAAECDAAFEADMADFERAVEAMVTVPLKQHQFDALVSFAYNVGVPALRGSTLLRKLNRGDHEGAALEFAKWNRGGGKVLKGLVRRRASEALLFQDIPDLDHDGVPDSPRMARRVTRSGGRAMAGGAAVGAGG